MKRIILALILGVLSVNAYAEKCEGFNVCLELYSKLTGKKLSIDNTISDEMTFSVEDLELTKENAESEFTLFLNKNAINYFKKNNQLIAQRQGEFLTSPVYIVSPGNMPQMFSKEGLVTLVYHSKNDPDKFSVKTRAMLSKKMPKPKSINKVIAYRESKIFVVSDTFEVAQKVMEQVFKMDK